MTLLSLKSHMREVKTSSLLALCRHFIQTPDYVRDLLGHWIRKGCVKQCTKTPLCGSKCSRCAPALVEIYEWL